MGYFSVNFMNISNGLNFSFMDLDVSEERNLQIKKILLVRACSSDNFSYFSHGFLLLLQA